MRNKTFQYSIESGFALPSVLFIATILTVLILVLLNLKYYRQKAITIELDRTKSLNAAISGIEKAINEIEKNGSFILPKHQQDFTFEFADGGKSEVNIVQWGAFLLADANGISGKRNHERRALIGCYPAKIFSHSLIFTNEEHQLILTGDSKIIGNVLLGGRGVTIGTLRDYQTPRKIPIEGSIGVLTGNTPSRFDIDKIIRALNDLEISVGSQNAKMLFNESILDLSTISKEISLIELGESCSITGKMSDSAKPIYIRSSSDISIGANTINKRFFILKTKGVITVQKDCSLENVILRSDDSIAILSGTKINGQIFAPKILIEQSANLEYPSVVCITPSSGLNSFILQNRALVQGNVLISKNTKLSSLKFEEEAMVSGMIYSESAIDFNAQLYGTMITKDFQFYDAPTQYYGWLRKGKIDRTKLPNGFMIPLGFSEQTHLGVLDWI